MTAVNPFEALVPEEMRTQQVDPIHAADVLGTIFSTIAGLGGQTGMMADQGALLTPPTSSAAPVIDSGTQPVTAGASSVPDGGTAFPVEGGQAPISSGFGLRGQGMHYGDDISVPVGSHAVAAISGTVTHAAGDDPGGYGNWIEITGANGISVRYGHLSTIGVNPGDTVVAGQSIGETGGAKGAPGAGNSEGPHLHFEFRQNGTPVDPAAFLAGGASVVGAAPTGESATPVPLDPEALVAAQTGVITDLLAGRQPQQQQQPAAANDMKVPTGDVKSTGSWAQDILAGIGAPVTPETLDFMERWMRQEGGAVHNNPLNTALDMPGATNWNDLGGGMHVKTYVDYEQGLVATIRTLLQENMAGIVAALKSGNASRAAQAVTASDWGTKNL